MIRAHAPAKINLHLAIQGQRADGYHDLTTVFQTIAWHDTLTFEAWEGPFEIRCAADGVPVDDRNLIWRAASLLAEATGRGQLSNVRVTLDKRLPLQAGLGGGSADAMATLRALGRLWDVTLNRETMRRHGARLGADVAFFADGGTMLGTGRGDALQPLPELPSRYVTIVVPPVGVSTADAYRWVAERRRGMASHEPTGGPSWPATSAGWGALLWQLSNDFEPIVAERFPAVSDAVARLRDAGAILALMSGSGSAVAGLFEREEHASHAASALAAPGWRTMVTRTLSGVEYQRLTTPEIVQS